MQLYLWNVDRLKSHKISIESIHLNDLITTHKNHNIWYNENTDLLAGLAIMHASSPLETSNQHLS